MKETQLFMQKKYKDSAIATAICGSLSIVFGLLYFFLGSGSSEPRFTIAGEWKSGNPVPPESYSSILIIIVGTILTFLSLVLLLKSKKMKNS